MLGTADALRMSTARRGLRIILGAFGVSALGDGVRVAALPLLVLSVTTNPIAVTGAVMANRLPWLLVALFSGAIVDRYDRRALMVIVDVCRAVVVFCVVILIATRTVDLPLLYLAGFALGTGETLFETATQALLPEVVPPDELPKANGQLYMVTLVGESFVGPSLGSTLFSVGRVVPFLMDAVSFVGSAALITFQRLPGWKAPNGRRSEKEVKEATSILTEVGEGVAWLREHALVRGFIAVSTTVNFTQSAAQSLLALYVVHTLHYSSWVFGFLLTAGGVGAFFGGMLSFKIGNRLGVHRVILPAVSASIPLFLLMAWTSNAVVLSVVLAANAFLGVMAGIQMSSLRQRIVPNQLLGRVSAVSQFFTFGAAIPLGAVIGGAVAEGIGVRAVFAGAAGVIAVLLCFVGVRLLPGRLLPAIEELVTANNPPGDLEVQ